MSQNRDSNGQLLCPISAVWDEAVAEINEIHKNMDSFVVHTQHLPVIARGIETMTGKLSEMNTTLLSAAIGREQVPLETVKQILTENNKNNATLYKSFSAITLGLLAVILFLLAGDHLGFLKVFHG